MKLFDNKDILDIGHINIYLQINITLITEIIIVKL